MASADIPWATASVKIVAAPGFDLGASIRAAPSSSEYSVWVWRWTNCSAIDPGHSPFFRPFPQPAPGCGELTRLLFAGTRRYARASTASRLQVAAGEPQRGGEVGRQRLRHIDGLPADRVVERQAPRVQERAGEPERARLVPRAAVGAVPHDRVTRRLQVHADLVGPAGARHRLEQRGSFEPFANLEARGG